MPLTGAWSVAGSGGTRTVTYGLHGPEITVRGLPNSAPVTVRGRLFGPFGKANVRCSDGKLYKQSAIFFTGDGTKTSLLKLRSSGFYAWRARIAESPLSLPGLSAFGQRFRVD